ncbi:metalloregulator ArsR/SmtB family transcription factor [Sphingomonas oligophenolica]|uniref:Metalloregulator ArsR/SmtB family transcription factor n=1 Tax=Sphingomonas oligophenolica TaxID=301154 RepID=A0ABU9XY64_9SPHN
MLDYQPIDSCFKALADSTRVAIFERLSRGPASVSDLAKPFSMSLTAIGQHLTILENSGLIRTRKIGRVRTCSVDAAGLSRLTDWVAERRSLVERRLDRLGQLLAAEDEDRPISLINKGEIANE